MYICDTEGASAKLAKAVTPSFLKKLTIIYQVRSHWTCVSFSAAFQKNYKSLNHFIIFKDSYPTNPKQAFMINLHPVIDGLCRLAMSFSNEKMKERTKFYSKDADLSFLHEALGKEVLPEEYGGTNGTMKMHVGKIY